MRFRHPVAKQSVNVTYGDESREPIEQLGGMRNGEHPMKTLLALVTVALTALILEEKARQVAGDAQEAYSGAVVQGREAKKALSRTIEQQPLVSLLVAGGLAYAVASLVPSRG